ncbi:MAG: DUF4432 family protein [Acidobacteriota bacterium]
MSTGNDTVIKAATWQTPWGAHPSLELDNGALVVTLLPQFGGKIVSIRRSSDSAEFLLQPQQPYRAPGIADDFANSDRGGFDDCFPSVSPIRHGDEISTPDHGDLWRLPWKASSIGDSIVLTVDAVSVPVTVQRRISLKAQTLHFDYDLHNFGNTRTSFLYAAHPLLQVEQGDRVLLPAEVERVRLEGWNLDDRPPGTFLDWPITALQPSGVLYDLSSVGPSDGISAAKIFAGPFKTGRAGLYRPKLRTGVIISFNAQQLPYLGLWISHGAWPMESAPTGHYTVAIEPTTAPYDSAEKAESAGLATVLDPGSSMSWRYSLSIAEVRDIGEFHRALEPETSQAAASSPSAPPCLG